MPNPAPKVWARIISHTLATLPAGVDERASLLNSLLAITPPCDERELVIPLADSLNTHILQLRELPLFEPPAQPLAPQPSNSSQLGKNSPDRPTDSDGETH
jgi:hypothetical protein